MLAQGMSQAEIARSLRITKSAVAYHVRRVREPDQRFRRRYDWKLVQAYYDRGHTVRECGLDDWRGHPLSLELHHINRVGHDNRLENLALLRPNCHSQTDSWVGRNCRDRARRTA
jgi:hypothetical protein